MSREHDSLEARLRAYRPAGPPPGLRRRVLAAALTPDAEADAPVSRRRIAPALWWGSAAAVLIVSFSLAIEANRIETQIAERLAPPRPAWSAGAEEAVELLAGADAATRRYVEGAMAAQARHPPGRKPSTARPPHSPGDDS